MALPIVYDDADHEVQVGVDEAGRGCLMGPVCAAAVVWDPAITVETHPLVSYIKDSKKLSAKRRHQVRGFIEQHAKAFGVCMVHAEEIDRINILQAAFQAMHGAIDQIKVPFDRILVDGNNFKPYISPGAGFIPHNCIIEGDNSYIQIAAASILAKTYRDEWVDELATAHPEWAAFKWEKNKGYGTKDHMEALRTLGVTPYHRLSFAPVAAAALI